MEDSQIFKQSRNFFSLLLLISIVLLFLNAFGFKQNLGILIVNPINALASDSAESLKGFFGVFEEMQTLRSQYYELQEDYLVLKAQSSLLFLLQEENDLLKTQLELEESVENLILAEVLYQDMNLRMENLILNKGEQDGIYFGDIVVMGDIFLGVVTEVNPKTSKVRLPTSRASSIKVMVLNDEEAFLNGIAVGYSNRIKVENIELLGSLSEGSKIVVNDTKIGEYLYLGEVYGIDDDPTATFQSTGVKLPLDYQNLKYVFVKGGQ